jgi:tetratricopeptide (TPR) repeat protein
MIRARNNRFSQNALLVALCTLGAVSFQSKSFAESKAGKVIEGHVETLNDFLNLRQVLDRATSDALNGDRTALGHFYQTGLLKELPAPSIDEIISILQKAKATSHDLALAGSPRLAAQRLRLVFDLCANLAGKSLTPGGDETLAWKETFDQFKISKRFYLPYLVYYANLLVAGGEGSCAINPLKLVIATEPDNVEAHKALSTAYRQLNRRRLSFKTLLEYQRLRRERIYTVGTVEACYDRSVDAPLPQKTISHHASNRAPISSSDSPLDDSTSAVWKLSDDAVFDIKDGDLEAALTKLKSALLIEPGHLGAQANLAVVLNNRAVQNIGRFDRNCQDLHAACVLMPANDISLSNLESTLKLIGLDPSSSAVRVRFGDLLLSTGDSTGALLEYKESLKTENNRVVQAKVDALIKQLGESYLGLNQKANAKTNLTCRATF